MGTEADNPGAAGTSETRGSRPTRAQRMEAIRAAAWRRFTVAPYDEVRLEQIAAEVGLARSTVQTYVGSKVVLYRECVDRAVAQFEVELARVGARGGDPEARARLVIGVVLDFAERQAPAWRVIERHLFAIGGPFAPDGDRMRARLLPALEWLVVGHSNLRRTGVTASAVLGSLHAIAAWRHAHADVPRDAVVEQVAAIFWRGMGRELGG